ncbi:peptide chain release factor N(5)-glutamine methyltransferase [Pseudooceanicola aestuarii]|uniref:peptide chain release factor N(5)-glutamine methyltransferase n=1 Tax=Pseudooceanicola aestuarii TaxID=2697319 RepID=UPI001EF864B3|nr:peptide chain release factor N(5)-glutamine methyltransferase [Pseudooceanicola aestuarii]
MTQPLRAALDAARRRLAQGGIPDPAGDARWLLAHATGLARDRLALHLDDPLDPAAAEMLDRMLARRLTREPVSHLIGRRAFWGRDFRVTADVLDPRPETESLVAEALTGTADRILDLGTGSGCILLTLLAERPQATGLGVDLSAAALAVAAQNAVLLGLGDRAVFGPSDWWEAVTGQWDLVVSNPPYIAETEMAGLSPELGHEPRMALTPGGDGLDAYRAIAKGAAAHLAPGGRLLVEIGPTQGGAVAAMFSAAGLSRVRVLPDLDGRDRVIAAEKLRNPDIRA